MFLICHLPVSLSWTFLVTMSLSKALWIVEHTETSLVSIYLTNSSSFHLIHRIEPLGLCEVSTFCFVSRTVLREYWKVPQATKPSLPHWLACVFFFYCGVKRLETIERVIIGGALVIFVIFSIIVWVAQVDSSAYCHESVSGHVRNRKVYSKVRVLPPVVVNSRQFQ